MIIELEFTINSIKGGIMGEPTSDSERHIVKIEHQVQDAFKDLEKLYKDRIIVRNANELEDIEREIVAATDKLAGLMTAHKVQQSIDSSELQEDATNLVKSSPKKLKNQGPREVEISLARGEPVKIKTNYYSRKGKKN
jgi:DNA-directed RNA polymerase specialized sigma subunit